VIEASSITREAAHRAIDCTHDLEHDALCHAARWHVRRSESHCSHCIQMYLRYHAPLERTLSDDTG
jgi:hypothetical protein